MVRRAENTEEGGVEESVCSIDGPSAVYRQESLHQQAKQCDVTQQPVAETTEAPDPAKAKL